MLKCSTVDVVFDHNNCCATVPVTGSGTGSSWKAAATSVCLEGRLRLAAPITDYYSEKFTTENYQQPTTCPT